MPDVVTCRVVTDGTSGPAWLRGSSANTLMPTSVTPVKIQNIATGEEHLRRTAPTAIPRLVGGAFVLGLQLRRYLGIRWAPTPTRLRRGEVFGAVGSSVRSPKPLTAGKVLGIPNEYDRLGTVGTVSSP